MLYASIRGCIHQNSLSHQKLLLTSFWSSCQRSWKVGKVSLIRRTLVKIALSHPNCSRFISVIMKIIVQVIMQNAWIVGMLWLLKRIQLSFILWFCRDIRWPQRKTCWLITLESDGHFFPHNLSRRNLFTIHSTSTTWWRIVTARWNETRRTGRIGVVRILLVGLVAILHRIMGRGGWIATHLRVGCRCIWVTTMTIKRRWRTIQRRWGAVSSCGGSELVVAGVMTSLRFLWSPIARICFHVIWRVLKLNLAWHHRRGQWKLFVNFVEVGLSFRVREQLSLIRLHPLHHSY